MALRSRLIRTYLANHPLEAARTMESLDPGELVLVLADADEQSTHALHLMDPGSLAAVMPRLSTEEAGRLLRLMTIDTQVSVLPLLDEAMRERLLSTLEPRDAGLLERLLSYPRQTAASLVEYDTFRIPSDISAADALERSRRSSTTVRFYVYVTDRDNRLVGVVSLKQLLRAPQGTGIAALMHDNPARIAATETLPEVVNHYQWRRFPILPVVDADDLLVGVILYETIQKLREEGLQESGWADTRNTLLALSEVYWLGLSTVLGSTPHANDKH